MGPARLEGLSVETHALKIPVRSTRRPIKKETTHDNFQLLLYFQVAMRGREPNGLAFPYPVPSTNAPRIPLPLPPHCALALARCTSSVDVLIAIAAQLATRQRSTIWLVYPHAQCGDRPWLNTSVSVVCFESRSTLRSAF